MKKTRIVIAGGEFAGPFGAKYFDKSMNCSSIRLGIRSPVRSKLWRPWTPPAPWHHLKHLLVEIGRIVPIRSYNESFLFVQTSDVLARIQHGDPSWETMVPATIASVIKTKDLFRSR